MKKRIFIISGYNTRAVISFCRFATANGIAFSIIACGPDDPILKTRYAQSLSVVRTEKELCLNDFFEWKKLAQDVPVVILPSTEYLNRFLLRYRSELESVGYEIPLCEGELYRQLSDKYAFGELCKDYGIPVPEELMIESLEFPCVAKPRNYTASVSHNLKPQILKTRKQYESFAATSNVAEYYFQEFVTGKSIYLLCYFQKSGAYSIYSQENLVQQSNGLSIIAAQSSTFHLKPFAIHYCRLLEDVQFCGLIMIEVRERNGRYVMIEANPRLWGPSQLILDSHMDLFRKFMEDYQVLDKADLSANYLVGRKYFWSGGLIEDSVAGKECCFHKDFTPTKFIQEYAGFINQDIYRREDTIGLYMQECLDGQ